MNKKTRKLLTWCLVVAMVLTQMLFTNIAFAATRTSGADRYKTAIAISQNFASADTVIIARGDGAADALAAAPLAYQKKAPILLTETGALTDGVLAEIQRLKAKNAIIVGGTGAVSANVESALKSAGLSTSRLSGPDRYATSLQIAGQLSGVKGVAVINGNDESFADALSISAIAGIEGLAIVSTDGQSISSDATAFIGSKKAYLVGGTAVVADGLVSGAQRLSGPDRYATNVAVINAFASDLKFNNVYVATGEDYPDALAGSVVAALNNAPIVLVGSSLSSATSDLLKSKTTKDSKYVVFGGTGAVSDSVASALDGSAPAPAGPVSVTSVTATAADTLAVQFSAVPADTSKVVFTVKNGSTPLTVTASWNGSVASLKYSAKFPQGTYAVSVKNDAADLGTTNVTVDPEKVAKIEVTTDKFAVTTVTQNNQTVTSGYFTYKVSNQYGEDITNKNLANIKWTVPGCSAPDEASNDTRGVVKATADSPGFNFLNLQSITVTGIDQSANISVSQTLGVSAATGTLSNFKLGDVSNANGYALQAGKTGEKWNIAYQASDLAGNATTNFVLLQNGLVDQQDQTKNTYDNTKIVLSTSGYIVANLVNKSGIGVIELTVDPSADNLTTDVPVTVTAITKNGVTSTLNLTLKKKSLPSTFQLMAPAQDIAYGDTKEIPFVCSDSDGNALTDFVDIVEPTSKKTAADNTTVYYTGAKNNSVSLSPLWDGTAAGSGLYFTQRGDNTAKLNYHAGTSANTTDMSVTLSATTISGKFSTITINIRPLSNATTMSVSDSSFATRLTPGAVTRLKHEWFTAKDKYGRTYDLKDYFTNPTPAVNGDGSKGQLNYAQTNADAVYVQVVPDNAAKALLNFYDGQGYQVADPTVAGTPLVIDRTQHIYIEGKNAYGTGTLTFKLIDLNVTDPTKQVIATKSVDFTVEKVSDIQGLKVTGSVATDTIYNLHKVNTTLGNSPTFAQVTALAGGNYKNSYLVYGVDGNGNQVVLPRSVNFTASATGNVTTVNIADDYTSSTNAPINQSGAADFNELQITSYYNDTANVNSWTSPITVAATITDENGTVSVKSTSVTVKVSDADAVAQSITGPDVLDKADYSASYKLADAVNVKDQYGKNMLKNGNPNNSVSVYIGGNPIANTNPTLSSLVSGQVITIVANNGNSFTTTVK